MNRPAVGTMILLLPFVSACAQLSAQPAVSVEATVAFTEGPTVAEDGTVYFTDLYSNRIMRRSPAGAVSVFRQPSNRANGLIFDSEWRLLACEGGDGESVLPRVTRTNMETGDIEVIADEYNGKQLHQPNDLSFDAQGRIYFTDRPGANRRPEQTGVHGVYRIDTDGSSAEGRVSNSRVFHNFYPGRSGDGMTIDSEGNLYVAAGLNNLRGTSETLDTVAGIHVFSPSGELLEHIPIPEDTITNAAFGGL